MARRFRQKAHPFTCGETALNKATLAAAAAALLIGASPIAYAQSGTGPHSAATAPGAAPQITSPQANAAGPGTEPNAAKNSAPGTASVGDQIQSDQLRASKVIGSTVQDAHNQDVGKVKDLVVDRDGRVAAVVVTVGAGFLGTGGKDVAVPMSDVQVENNRLTLNETKQQLQQAQKYQLEKPEAAAGPATLPAQSGHRGPTGNSNPAH